MDKNIYKNFLKHELSGWKKWEIAWLAVATGVILSLSLFWHDSLVALFAALTGVICVILTGKGKVSNFLFGFFNVLLYAYLSWKAGFYGEVMLNMLYYFPCNFIGVVCWMKHMDESGDEVVKERMGLKESFIVYPVTGICVVAYGFLLKRLGGTLPFVDSLSTVLSITAQILCIKRYAEQWILWIVIDAVSVIMWVYDFVNGGENISTFLMWAVYLLNAVIMYVKWRKESKPNV